MFKSDKEIYRVNERKRGDRTTSRCVALMELHQFKSIFKYEKIVV